MKNPPLVLINTNDPGNTILDTYDDDDDIDHDDYMDDQERGLSTCDCLKMIIIVILLAGSIILYTYEPLTPVTEPPPLQQVPSNLSNQTEVEEVEENPYGFHPFYQVHKRVQYKSPTVNPCNDMDPKRTILLALLSRASNVHIREAIRHSWGSVRTYNDIEIRVTFVVGVDDGMVKQIEMEQNVYHDLVQVNLPENYPVVSYKELAALCWSKYFCPDVQYVFKADEDIHLNTPLLARILGEYMKNETFTATPLMLGWFRQKSRVDRSGRYLVTEEEYPGFYYPPYTFGIGYALTKAGRDQLCERAVLPHPVTRVGDAYITGILRDHAMVKPVRFGDVHYIYSYTLNGVHCHEYFTYDPKLLVCMSSLHSGTNDVADEYVRVWNAVYRDGETEVAADA